MAKVWVAYTEDWGSPCYLAWQHPGYEDTGYFWTAKENLNKLWHWNTKSHPFLFTTKEAARQTIRKLNLPQKYKIVQIDL